MLYPSIDSLLTKVDSKYKLVTVAAKRARQLQEHDNSVLENVTSSKLVGKSLEEIHHGHLHYKEGHSFPASDLVD